MRKNYVLDTNVLLHDPKAILSFGDNYIFLPVEVIMELDNFKGRSDELGANARAVSRNLDDLRELGHLNQGVDLPNGGRLQILWPHSGNGKNTDTNPTNGANGNGTIFLIGHKTDHRIIEAALTVSKNNPSVPTILVTKDVNMRITADAVGLSVEDFKTDRVPLQDLYSGTFELMVSEEQLRAFKVGRELGLDWKHSPNEYCALSATMPNGKIHTVLAKVHSSGTKLVPIIDTHDGIWGIVPRNREQHYALDALLDDRIELVTLMGKAGTGKTLLAIAAALREVLEGREFRRVVVARPTISVGKEIGFLPGTLEEKLNPWMQPIHDALEYLADLRMGTGTEKRRPRELLTSGSVVVEALCYIRGRSIANQFMIIDEAQNLTPLEVKTIITRVGQGTKIVFTGDPYQIDNPYVDSSSNGFSYLVSKFREQEIAAHVSLVKGERSRLAEVAANIL